MRRFGVCNCIVCNTARAKAFEADKVANVVNTEMPLLEAQSTQDESEWSGRVYGADECPQLNIEALNGKEE